MNKIILAILIGIAISSLTYGALNAPAVDVQLLFLGFFTDKDQFSNFECSCANPLPGADPSSGFSSQNCPLPANFGATPALASYQFASSPNICT